MYQSYSALFGSQNIWSCIGSDTNDAYYYDCSLGNCPTGSRENNSAIVFLRKFDNIGDSLSAPSLSYNPVCNKALRAKDSNKEIPSSQTQQSINKPGNNSIDDVKDVQNKDFNNPVTPNDDTNKNVETGGQAEAGQNSSTTTAGQSTTDSGGTANTSQSTAPPNISANAPIATG